jgi:hypothetical protein
LFLGFYLSVPSNSQYSSLEAAFDQAGSIDFYSSYFLFFTINFFGTMSSFADELRHQGLLEDTISFDSSPSTVDDAPTTGGVADDTLGRTTTLLGSGVAAGTKEKVFKLFLVETIGADEELYYFSFIGKGATECMKRGCATNHNGERVIF